MIGEAIHKRSWAVAIAFLIGAVVGGTIVCVGRLRGVADGDRVVAPPGPPPLARQAAEEGSSSADEGALSAFDRALGSGGMERTESLVSAAAAFSPEQTLARILAIKDRRARSQMLGGLMQSWLLRDPDAAMNALAEAGVRGPERQNVLRRALNGMAESHPTEAFALLTKHPEVAGEGLYRDKEWNGTAVQPEMTRDLANRWLREDSMQATQPSPY